VQGSVSPCVRSGFEPSAPPLVAVRRSAFELPFTRLPSSAVVKSSDVALSAATPRLIARLPVRVEMLMSVTLVTAEFTAMLSVEKVTFCALTGPFKLITGALMVSGLVVASVAPGLSANDVPELNDTDECPALIGCIDGDRPAAGISDRERSGGDHVIQLWPGRCRQNLSPRRRCFAPP